MNTPRLKISSTECRFWLAPWLGLVRDAGPGTINRPRFLGHPYNLNSIAREREHV